MAHHITIRCGCNGHSHCPKCHGTGKTDSHITTHPKCNMRGCHGTMFPVDGRPGARLKCNACKRVT